MSACGLHCCSHCWWSQGLFSQMNAPCISHDAMPICLFSAFILPRSATLSLSLAMSLSLNEMRKWFWRIWTIMFPDILKWIGQQIWKKILNRSKHRWVNIQKGGGHEIGGDDWFFSFSIVFFFMSPTFYLLKSKKEIKVEKQLKAFKNQILFLAKLMRLWQSYFTSLEELGVKRQFFLSDWKALTWKYIVESI